MINAVINGLLNFAVYMIGVIFTPIDTFIANNFPTISSGLTAINTLFSYILNFIGYCIDASGLSSVAIALIVGYFAFSILASFTMHIIKLILKWYQALIP